MDKETPQVAEESTGGSTGDSAGTERRGSISQAILRVARMHRALQCQILREVGLHPAQELVMMQLWERGQMRQTDLAHRLGTDAATMTRTIQRLEKAGFVRRARSTSDKRSVLVESTTAGNALRKQVEALSARLEDYAAGGFTDTELSKTLAVLERLETNLAAQTGCAGPPPRPGTTDA